MPMPRPRSLPTSGPAPGHGPIISEIIDVLRALAKNLFSSSFVEGPDSRTTIVGARASSQLAAANRLRAARWSVAQQINLLKECWRFFRLSWIEFEPDGLAL